jgi:hypothetical protein
MQSVHRPRRLSSLELLIVLTILGIFVVLAVGEIQEWSRRNRTEEAVRGIADIFNGIAANFNEARPDYDATGLPTHRCPHRDADPLAGEVEPTPPLSIQCTEGPRSKCTPVMGAELPGTYELSAWTADPVWLAIGFRHTGGHNFHYSYSYRNIPTDDGHGSCEFTVRATADLDGDGEFSVFERSGYADRTGVRAEEGLRIANPLE